MPNFINGTQKLTRCFTMNLEHLSLTVPNRILAGTMNIPALQLQPPSGQSRISWMFVSWKAAHKLAGEQTGVINPGLSKEVVTLAGA